MAKSGKMHMPPSFSLRSTRRLFACLTNSLVSFKNIVDGASACALAGNYTIDDEKFIRFKAKTILDCYLESTLPPKLQVGTMFV